MKSWQNDKGSQGQFWSMRAICCIMPLFLAVFAGCYSISLTHDFGSPLSTNSPGGRYDLSGVDKDLAESLRKYAPAGIVFTCGEDPCAMPLKIHVSKGEERDTSSVAQGLLSALSLFVFPLSFERNADYMVGVESPNTQDELKVKLIERELFSSTPLGWIPASLSLDGYVYAVSLDQYERVWTQTKESVRSEYLLTVVAKAVLSTLTQSRYDGYVAWKAKKDKKDEIARLREKKIADANNREKVLRQTETGWRNEAKLRELALKEMPEIWDIIVERRARISEQRKNLIRLRKLIIESGKVPESDAEYVAGRRQYDEERTVLLNVFLALEKSYYEVSKAELTGNSEAHANRKKAIEECVREILVYVGNEDGAL